MLNKSLGTTYTVREVGEWWQEEIISLLHLLIVAQGDMAG